MDLWGILVWIIVGGLAGWVASKIVGTDKNQGALGNIAVGVVGALVGGFLVGLIGGEGFTGLNLWSFLVSLLGAVILLFLWKAMRGRKA